MVTTIKLSRRMAERLLENENCKVIISKCHPREIFITRAGITNNRVYIPSEHIIVPIEDITSIFYINRFGSGMMMEVDWNQFSRERYPELGY